MSANQNRLVEYIVKRTNQLRSKKNDKEISIEAGFNQPNVISQIKAGKMKLSLSRVPAMAKALECDPAMLFRLAWEQYYSRNLLNIVIKLARPDLTENEIEILEFIREASEDGDPKLTNKLKTAIQSALK